MKRKKRNPNLSKYDAPLRIQFERGLNAFRGNQYIRSVNGIKIIATENPYNSNTMQYREWQRGYNFAYFKQLEKVNQNESRRRGKEIHGS
tara:strand:+ start:754 stop:1023 length:270 start_codon:yes stop_codon:yes gene_type:complete